MELLIIIVLAGWLYLDLSETDQSRKEAIDREYRERNR